MKNELVIIGEVVSLHYPEKMKVKSVLTSFDDLFCIAVKTKLYQKQRIGASATSVDRIKTQQVGAILTPASHRN